MSEFRQTTVDLYDAADEVVAEAEREVEEVRAELREEAQAIIDDPDEPFESVEELPQRYHDQYEQAGQVIREAHKTASTYRHAADQWTSDDSDECVFVLEELNGDEYAATIDAVSAEAGRQARRDGSLPEGFGKVKSLEYGVVEKPDGAPANPGQWHPAIVNELFGALNDIGAPAEVDLGNESLAEAMTSNSSGSETAAPDGGSSRE